jgi:hypothetical protein
MNYVDELCNIALSLYHECQIALLLVYRGGVSLALEIPTL